MDVTGAQPAAVPIRWAKVIDQDKCIGCHACTTACKSENEVPIGVTRTYVKAVEVGIFPEARRSFQVTRCNQCADAPCVTACPTTAMFARPDGIIDFNKSACIGCKACIAACPYDAIFINPEDHSAEKCNFCAHRIDQGLEPACVVVCPVEAILVGDLNDPTAKVTQIVNRQVVQVRRPEKETRPKLFYKGAHQATLDPLAARRPDGGLYAWAEQPSGPQEIGAGNPGRANSSAAVLLAYDVSHTAPWGWRVGAYIWTKSIAAGAYLVPLLLVLLGKASWQGPLWTWFAPLAGTAFMLATLVFLVLDLKHPKRFLYVLTRPQWRSWLVRGAFVITAYAALLGFHLLASVAGVGGIAPSLAYFGVPLAAMTAIYTAYLLAQAKARDLWQNPLLPPHLFVQAMLAGAAICLPAAAVLEPALVAPLVLLLAGSALVHLLFVAGELTLTHATAHAHLATKNLTRGPQARVFWTGQALLLCGVASLALGPWVAPLALAGLAAHEHAYIQAGQSVPLA